MKFLLFFLLSPFLLFAQHETFKVEKDQTPLRELQIDQLHLAASLQFDTIQNSVSGIVIITAISLQDKLKSVALDAINFDVSSVSVYGQENMSYEVNDKQIELSKLKDINKNDSLIITIVYSARPYRGLFFVGWEDKKNTAPRQIWSQGQGIDNRHWLPHVDDQNDKLTTHIEVDFASNYEVISNGKRTAKTALENGMTRWIFDMEKPHSSYLIMLAIGKYDFFKERSAAGTDIENYFYPHWENRNAWTYFKNKEIFSFLETEIPVAYPWPNYKQVPVMNFQHGAMENTSATIFGDFFCVDSISFNDRNYVGVNAHELAHQWFGNDVTSTGSAHHWLHEGFASYYAWLAEGEVFGANRFAFLRKQSLDNVVMAEAQDMFPLAHGKAGSWRFYDKGAWVVHMLRLQVGEQAWRVGLEGYLQKNAFAMVETDDLQKAMETASGQNLQWFFDQWVYRPQIPNLDVHISMANDVVKIEIKQKLLPNQPNYRLEIPVRLVTTERTFDMNLSLKNEVGKSSLQIPSGEKLLAIFPDPDFNILATWQVSGDLRLLENMAKNEDAAWYAAVDGLVSHSDYQPKIAAKIADAHVLHRIAFAQYLAEKTKSGKDLINEEILFLKYEEDLEVIKTFVRGTNQVPAELYEKCEEWLELPSYDIQEKVLTLLVLSDKKNAQKYLALTDNIYGTSGNNVRMTWLLFNQFYGDKTSTAELVNYMSPEYDFLTRMNAFSMAEIAEIVNYKSATGAFFAILQNNRKLRNAAKNYIVKMSEESKNKTHFQRWVTRNKFNLSAEDLARIESMTGYVPE